MSYMKSFKKSFILQFMLYFFISMIVLWVVQSIIWTLRFYNPSEQDYERLAPQKNTDNLTKKEDINVDATIKNTELPTEPDLTPDTNEQERTYPVAKEKKIQTIEFIEQSTTVKSEKKTEKKTQKKTSSITLAVTPKTEKMPKWYEQTIISIVSGTYFKDALWRFPIIINTETKEPRWQMYNESITLSWSILSLQELWKVLVHELAHMIDIYTFQKKWKEKDISEDFYKISWQDPTTLKPGIRADSFVSWYASTNQYEDFAESFTMYVFHNNDFLRRGKTNEILNQKYMFFRTYVFWDAFIGTAQEKSPIPKKVWDVTKIAIQTNSIQDIFAWINTKIAYKL